MQQLLRVDVGRWHFHFVVNLSKLEEFGLTPKTMIMCFCAHLERGEGEDSMSEFAHRKSDTFQCTGPQNEEEKMSLDVC